mgnify:CR=1 FL=1
MLTAEALSDTWHVCSGCGYHHPMTPADWRRLLLDVGHHGLRRDDVDAHGGADRRTDGGTDRAGNERADELCSKVMADMAPVPEIAHLRSILRG